MMHILVLGLLGCFAHVRSVPLPAPFTEHCIVGEKNLYSVAQTQPPIKWYTIDLDQPADQRWNEVATDYSDKIRELIGVIKNFTVPFFQDKLIDWIDNNLDLWDNRLPEPYASELRGMARVTGVPLGEIVLYNIFYEIFTVCTSIVAQDPSGKLYHARNLDFGLFLGWDYNTHEWMVTSKLRDIVINLEWKKNNQTFYKSVNFAGYVGIYNGLKQNKFTITANERFDVDGGYRGIAKWLEGDNTAKWMTWLTRDTMEQADSYEEAVFMLSNRTLMSPVYFIVGGSAAGEGCIVTRSREGTLNVKNLAPSQPNGWYILETNYDNWEPPLFIDDRRTPGNECMQKLGQANVGFEGIFNVLSSQSNLNMLTAYTVLMQVNAGDFETYLQKCEQPCWFA
jgi:acid ceramidase